MSNQRKNKSCFCLGSGLTCGGFENGDPINSPAGTSIPSLANIQNGIFNNTRTWLLLQPSQCPDCVVDGETCYGCVYLTYSLQAYIQGPCPDCQDNGNCNFPPQCPAIMQCSDGGIGLTDTIVCNFNNYFTNNVGPYIQDITANPSCFPTSVTQNLAQLYPVPQAGSVEDVCGYLEIFTPFANALMAMTTYTSSFLPTNTPQAASGTLLNQQQTAFFNAMQTWPANLCTEDCSSTAVTTFQSVTGPALNGAYDLISQNLVVCYTTDQIEQFRSLDTQLQSLLTGTPSGQDICDYFNDVTDTTKAFNYQFMLGLTSCPG